MSVFTQSPPSYPNVKHRLKHSSRASNIRAAGRGQIKHAELITHKKFQLIEFTWKLGLQLQKNSAADFLDRVLFYFQW